MLRQSNLSRTWGNIKADLDIRLNKRQGPTTDQCYRVGIIGLGRVARRHIWGYLQTETALLAAGAEPNQRVANKARKKFGIGAVYEDFHDLLATEQLDIISICTPPQFHASAIVAAAGAGVKGILCEKPLCSTLQEVDSALAACSQSNTALAVSHQRRFGPQHQAAKKLLDEGALGTPHLVIVNAPGDTLRAGIHIADLLRFYLGEVVSVAARLEEGHGCALADIDTIVRRGYSGDNRGTILVRFATSQSIAVIQIKNCPRLDVTLHFVADRGEMEVWYDGGLRIKPAASDHWETPKLVLNPFFLEFKLQIESLMTAIQNQTPPEVGGMDGRKSLEIVTAILRSSNEGKEIRLPL